MDSKLILVTCLIKLGISAAVASAVVRSIEFKKLLFREQRSTRQKILLTLFLAIPLATGVYIRCNVRNFLAADLALECSILVGLIGGRFCGILAGCLVSIASIVHKEFMACPVNVLAGLAAGLFRNIADREEIWSFSPFFDLSIYRWIRRNLPRPHLDWQISLFLLIVVLQAVQMEAALIYPHKIFVLYDPKQIYDNGPNVGLLLAVCATTIAVVAIPLKIWNSVRIELKLEVQEKLLIQARLDALQSQINPHFLFNTLNSVSSLVRVEPETARALIVKLSSILRSLLRKHDAFVPLREELEFIDNYLDIEVVRFGEEKLRVLKEVDPSTMELIVPSMLLQPLVENSIKHGLTPKIDGGTIIIRSKLKDEILMIEVADDGVGMPDNPEAAPLVRSREVEGLRSGIGLANVADRINVLYGTAGKMTVISVDGSGTTVRLELPLVHDHSNGPSTLASLVYATRSNTRS